MCAARRNARRAAALEGGGLVGGEGTADEGPEPSSNARGRRPPVVPARVGELGLELEGDDVGEAARDAADEGRKESKW